MIYAYYCYATSSSMCCMSVDKMPGPPVRVHTCVLADAGTWLNLMTDMDKPSCCALPRLPRPLINFDSCCPRCWPQKWRLSEGATAGAGAAAAAAALRQVACRTLHQLVSNLLWTGKNGDARQHKSQRSMAGDATGYPGVPLQRCYPVTRAKTPAPPRWGIVCHCNRLSIMFRMQLKRCISVHAAGRRGAPEEQSRRKTKA